jgi:tRNA G18 (ribose-2'-O)-methylase SpoU
MRKLKNAELNRLDVDSFKQAPKSPLVLVIDNVRSTHNVGSIFRTADAFRVQEIFLCGITATPPHKDIRKTALGSTESVQWQYCEKTIDAIQNLQSKGILPDTTYALVFGHEVKGVSQDVVSAADAVLEIPQKGTKHSLNVSVSVGLVVWELFSSLTKQL